ncbi:hypothetical protein ABID22_003559 [Pontibacter aydingkolensis]|uniref:Uncharacterized protein n=1 Tax=Pontibacter aydingkolensis TaxID=1911536 RepID=A0ABS7CYF1_9BACT|nr:hypothetical protein [Pontibacter aydingkolensis]MBW7468891.1 hypothetical protein [Pontibacter aydingkolensis]
MPNPQESKIEDFAFDYLKGYYTSQQGAKNVLIGRAEKSKQGVEVEGLFAFKHPDNILFLATVTFKNANRLAALLTTYKKDGLSKLRFVTPVLLLALGSYLSLQFNIGLSGFALTFCVAAVGFVLHTYLSKAYLKRNINTLVDELKKHQANEQWLGLSISSLIFRNNSLANYFLKLCQRRGIGVITVGKRSKVVLIQEPRTNVCRKGDFLSHYISEDSIRKAIQDDTILRVA